VPLPLFPAPAVVPTPPPSAPVAARRRVPREALGFALALAAVTLVKTGVLTRVPW
jgi:hypothetical protein